MNVVIMNSVSRKGLPVAMQWRIICLPVRCVQLILQACKYGCCS